MAKINFTKEHYERMTSLLLGMLMENATVPSLMGSPIDVVSLLHCTTINSLNGIKQRLAKEIEKNEQADEWIQTDAVQERIERLKVSKELVNLVVGYKRWLLEKENIQRRKERLTSKIEEIKEAQKTPEDKLKEAEAELDQLSKDDFNF